MTGKKADPSPESIARANRQRLAFDEGLKAMADVERDAAAIRKNMERLRALRVAKEAEDIRIEAETPKAPVKAKRKARVAK
jgi:hypothetical protein